MAQAMGLQMQTRFSPLGAKDHLPSGLDNRNAYTAAAEHARVIHSR